VRRAEASRPIAPRRERPVRLRQVDVDGARHPVVAQVEQRDGLVAGAGVQPPPRRGRPD
jgi:hypothetical protein